MPRIRSALAVALFVVIGILCIPTAGDAEVAASASPATTTRTDGVVGQQLVVLEVRPASEAPNISSSEATDRATSYLGAAGQKVGIQAEDVILTIRDDQGKVAWGVVARPVWLIRFTGFAYPSALGSQDCSCQMNYWRPNTAVALDAATGVPVIKLGVAS